MSAWESSVQLSRDFKRAAIDIDQAIGDHVTDSPPVEWAYALLPMGPEDEHGPGAVRFSRQYGWARHHHRAGARRRIVGSLFVEGNPEGQSGGRTAHAERHERAASGTPRRPGSGPSGRAGGSVRSPRGTIAHRGIRWTPDPAESLLRIATSAPERNNPHLNR